MSDRGYQPTKDRGAPSSPPNQGSAGSSYEEVAKAYEKLAAIIRAYDAYRERGVQPAPDQYAAVVAAIDDARTIMGPQFKRPER